MTQTKTSKRALLTSALSLLLCCTMLIGTTWAWFTDSVTSAGNKIQSGTLQVDLLVKGGNTDYTKYTSVKTDHKPIFNYDLWEPGYTLVTNAKVVNNGTLALKYTLKFVSADDIASQKLAEVIDVYYSPSEVTVASRDDIASLNYLGTLKDVFTQGEAVVMNDNLEPKGKENCEDFATIVLKMKEEAGNEYQNQTISAFDIQLLATQWTYENDTFDNQYDVNATYPIITASSVTDATADLVLRSGNITVTIPANTANADDKFELVINNGSTETDAQGNTTVSYDIELLKNGVKVTSGDVEYPVTIDIGTGFSISSVKHNGTEIASYTYNAEEGIVGFVTKGFSPFSVTYKELPKIAKIGDKEYFSLDMAAKDAKSGDTIELTEDITVDTYVQNCSATYLGGSAMIDILDKGVTFDGKGHTITMGGNEEAFAFGKLYGTVKDVTFVDVKAALAGNLMLGCKFDGVTVEGEFDIDGNCAVFGIYTVADSKAPVGSEIVFKDCVNKTDITGTGTSSDYNAIFVGYTVYSSKMRFVNCVNEGSIVCGYAGMFVSNPNTYGRSVEIIVENCRNDGLIHSTYAGEDIYHKHNILYGVTSEYSPSTTVDGVSYTFAQVKNHEADDAIGGTGTYKVGNPNETLAISENQDGTFTVTPSNNTKLAYYKVNVGLYVSLNAGGSGRYYVTEQIAPASIGNATQVKNLKFVDKAWVEANSTAVESTAAFDANQKIYTLDGVDYYYVMNDTAYNTHGDAKEATLISVSAFDSNGNLLTSA